MPSGAYVLHVDDREFRKLLISLAVRSHDLSSWFREKLDPSVSKMLRQHWDGRGRYSGGWKPLRPASMIARIRPGHNKGGVNYPLYDTGRLRQSLLSPHHHEAIRVITRDHYERGTQVPYARYHHGGFTVRQWGGRRFHKARKVAPRPVIPQPPHFYVRGWARSLAVWVEKGKSA